ncbi:MAG: hypothetical protein AAFN77_16590 [Planctomycetota bacterium]
MLKPAICIGLGILLLGYSFYSTFFTGSELERQKLLAGGKEATSEVRLTPAMNPLRAFVRAKNRIRWTKKDIREKLNGEIEVEIVMSDSTGNDLWNESTRFIRSGDETSSSKIKDSTQFLKTFEVPSDGDYSFSGKVAVHHGTPEIVELVIYTNVSRVHWAVVIVGVLLLLGGAALVLLDNMKKQSTNAEQARSDGSAA